MDLRFLTTFIEVSKTKHFGKAAENLYLTPAAVSARIKQVEEYFNATLFTRVRTGIQLTPAGERLLPYAQEMLSALKQARSSMAEQESTLLVCGATPNANALILNQALLCLNKQFKQLSIKAEVHCGEQLSRQLQERTIDFAFTAEPLKSSDIQTFRLKEYPLKIYSTAPMSLTEAMNAFIQVDWSTKLSEQNYQLYPQTRHYLLRSNSVQTAIDFANQTHACLFLPDHLSRHLNKAHLIDDAPSESVSVFLACRKDERMSEKKSIIEALVDDLNQQK